MWIFLDLSITITSFFPIWFSEIESMRAIIGFISFSPSISTIVESLPWISRPWFPAFVFTPSNLILESVGITFGKIDSSFPQRTTLIVVPLPFMLNLNPVPGCPFEFVKFSVDIEPVIFPDTTKSVWFSFVESTFTVIESIDGISLSPFVDSIEEPDPTLIVGLPFRSDFTYALMILIRSPGFRVFRLSMFAFSSHSLTLAVFSPSYTVIVLRKNGVPSLRVNCFEGEKLSTLVSNVISLAPT